nr:MAG TPA: hypothetical protein [Caudoviricetes sp.]
MIKINFWMHISHWQSIYFNLDGSLQQGGLLWIINKKL